MHFVKKENIDSEEKNAQQKKRQAKLLAFTQARDRVFEKRKNREYDDEIMSLTGELLNKNPDIYTLWNVRREAVEHFSQLFSGDETSQEEKTSRLAKLIDTELNLTQECLMRNPKSYSSWHHRFLMLQRHPKPDFPAEMALCERALSIDCRNFHCWDHCRSLARLANFDAVEQFSFSDRMIGKNPSNYSAWHFRANLLPKIYPNLQHPEMAISDECLAKEFEKVLHVCGVNSEDQTGWTYCRWLVEIASAQSKVQNFSTLPTCTRELPRKCLNDLVKLCEELNANEDNPWAISALIRAKLALEGVNEETMALANKNCEKLQEIDPQRKEMYTELMDKLRLVDALGNRKMPEGENDGTQLDGLTAGNGRLVLKGIGLNNILHLLPLAGLITELNLEDNQIGDNQLHQLASFQKLTHLTLDGNPIRSLPPIQLPCLNFLSLARTKIGHFADIQSAICAFSSLQRLILCETELASNPEEQKALREGIKNKSFRIIFHWL